MVSPERDKRHPTALLQPNSFTQVLSTVLREQLQFYNFLKYDNAQIRSWRSLVLGFFINLSNCPGVCYPYVLMGGTLCANIQAPVLLHLETTPVLPLQVANMQSPVLLAVSREKLGVCHIFHKPLVVE